MIEDSDRNKVTRHIFIQYLAKKGALVSWLDQTNNMTWGVNDEDIEYQKEEENTLERTMGTDLLEEGFDIAYSKEGKEYWEELAVEFNEIEKDIITILEYEKF